MDRTQLELAVLNLAINARDAMEIGGRLAVETANTTLGDPVYPEEPPGGEYVSICASDTGAGMTNEVRQKAFEPFFTTKEIGKGSGLGLSQVLGFAKQSGGGVRITSQLEQGTSILIFLPRAEGRQGMEIPPAGVQAPAYVGGATILLVDDDNAVREVTAAMLRDFGYTVHEVGSGGAALDFLEREQNIDLMLIDFAMPGMSGADVARRVHMSAPSLPTLFVAGFADRTALTGVSESRIIGKPFEPGELARKVRNALAERGPSNVVRFRG